MIDKIITVSKIIWLGFCLATAISVLYLLFKDMNIITYSLPHTIINIFLSTVVTLGMLAIALAFSGVNI